MCLRCESSVMFWPHAVIPHSPALPPTHPRGSDGLQVDQTEKCRPAQEEAAEARRSRGGRAKWRRRLVVRLVDAPVRQAAGDAAEDQPQPVRPACGLAPGDPEAAPGAEDGAGGRRAQTAEKGRRRSTSVLDPVVLSFSEHLNAFNCLWELGRKKFPSLKPVYFESAKHIWTFFIFTVSM